MEVLALSLFFKREKKRAHNWEEERWRRGIKRRSNCPGVWDVFKAWKGNPFRKQTGKTNIVQDNAKTAKSWVCWGPEKPYLPEKKVDFSEKKRPETIWVMMSSHISLLHCLIFQGKCLFSYDSLTGKALQGHQYGCTCQKKRRDVHWSICMNLYLYNLCHYFNNNFLKRCKTRAKIPKSLKQ